MYVEMKNIFKQYGNFRASDNVNFGIEKGKLVALLGPSGSGKTTILRMIAGLETPSFGDIYIDGKRVNDVPANQREIGFVFQNYALFRHMTVYDNIAFGLKLKKVPKDEIKKRVTELLDITGLAGLEKRYPNQLSGGQRQRVAFARALAPNPSVLLLDEPFAAIDAKVRTELRTWLRSMVTRLGITSIFVTHDQDEAVEVADEIIITNHGKIEQMGSPIEIYKSPATPFVVEFIGKASEVNDYSKLKESQRILFDIDTESTNFNPDRRFVQKVAGEGAFAALRGYRLNYYAVTAILARVYLYAGMNDEAYAEAKKLIDEEEKTKYFAADESYYASDNFKNGNMKMYDNIIFALYSPTELVDWDSEINHLTDGKSESDQNYLSWSSKMLDAVYGIEKENDFRFKYQLESKYYGYNYRTLKYYKQVESTEYGKANNQIIPMIRMSEVYYIAAEAIYTEGDLLKIAEAKSYLEKVKKGRGIKTVDYSSVSSKNDFVNMIVNDARREFFGEGQTLYMFKRLNKVLTCDSGEIPMTEEYVVLPLPDSESNIK